MNPNPRYVHTQKCRAFVKFIYSRKGASAVRDRAADPTVSNNFPCKSLILSTQLNLLNSRILAFYFSF